MPAGEERGIDECRQTLDARSPRLTKQEVPGVENQYVRPVNQSFDITESGLICR